MTSFEVIPELAQYGRKNLAKYKFAHARILKAKPNILGLPRKIVDKILVSAAAEVLSETLLPQFSKPLVIPV